MVVKIPGHVATMRGVKLTPCFSGKSQPFTHFCIEKQKEKIGKSVRFGEVS